MLFTLSHAVLAITVSSLNNLNIDLFVNRCIGMSRPLRIEYAGALYHVTSRGNAKEPIYLDDGDYKLFLKVLAKACERYNWVIHSYCLMNNHYHLLVETPDGNLSRGMRQLNGVYTQKFNYKHQHVGHIFQGRYKAILVDKQSYLMEVSRYIVLNPMRAHLVEQLDQYPWSSWFYTLGRYECPQWFNITDTLQLFSRSMAAARQAYVRFVYSGAEQKLWNQLKQQIYLGCEEFVEKHLVTAIEATNGHNLVEIPVVQRRPNPLTLEEYEQQMKSRNQAIIAAYESGGYSLKQIADYFGLHYSWVSRIIAKRKT